MIDLKYLQYAQDILTGKIVSGKLIQLACQRYLDWIDGKEPDIEFKPECVDRCNNFINHLRHSTGIFNRLQFILLPWQYWLICNIFGFYNKSTGKRVFRYAYIQISRKNGKSSLSAALGLYMMICDEVGAEVDIVAPSRDLSNICFTACYLYLLSINKANMFKALRKDIFFKKKNSKLQVMSSDAKFGDGFNTSCGIIDEFHAFRNTDIYDLLTSSMGMRLNPLLIMITTAGFNVNSPCKKYRDTCIEILFGRKKDNSVFAAIYEMDPDDKWDNPEMWVKASPSLGITVQLDYMHDLVQKAVNNPSLLSNVLTKNLNYWLSSREIWIPDKYLENVYKQVDLTQLIGEIAYGGVDIGATSDLTCFTLLFPPNQDRQYYPDKFIFKSYAYLPETALDESVNGEIYKEWKRDGHITITPGNSTDLDYMLKDLLKMAEQFEMQYIAYDKWQSLQWALNATDNGIYIYPFALGIGHFSSPTKTFEMLVRSGNCIIEDTPVVRFCMSNVQIKEDYNNNIKPVKSEGDRNNKIDEVITMIEALGAYMECGNGNDFITVEENTDK